MATCPECDFEIDIDEYDVDKGDTLGLRQLRRALEVVSLNPIELDVVSDDDEDEDEEDDDLDEDEDEKTRTTTSDRDRPRPALPPADDARLMEKEARLRQVARRARVGHRGVQRRRRQRLPRVGRHVDVLGDAALVRHRRQPQLPVAPSRRRRAPRPRLRPPPRVHRDTPRWTIPAYRANEPDRCYHCKHELFTQPGRDRARARDCRGARRRERGRSRRLPAGPQGRSRVRRAQPARRGGSDEGRHPRVVAPRGAAHLGRARVGVPVVADSVPLGSQPGEARDDRARRRRAASPSGSACAASAITTTSPASNWGRTR